MPLELPSGYADVTCIWSLDGDPEKQTVNFGVDAASGATADDIADDVVTAFSAWQAQWGSAYTYLGAHVRLNNGGTITEDETPVAVNSGASAANPPQNVALLVRKTSGLAGRAHRGRFYFPPGRLSEVDVNNYGMIDGADLAVIQGEVNDLYDALVAAASIDAIVLLHTNPATAPTPVTNFTVEQRVATQRRRLRG